MSPDFEQPGSHDDDYEAFIKAGGKRPADGALMEGVQSGDRRKALEAMRDFTVWELEGHRCHKCAMSQLRTGDTAALLLRLSKILEDIEALPPEVKEVSGLAGIRKGRGSVTDIQMGRKRRGDRDGSATG